MQRHLLAFGTLFAYVNPRPDLSAVAPRDLDHVQDDAVKDQERARIQAYNSAVIAVEGWPDYCAVPDSGEAFL
jgi:hypothetical protein